MKADRSVVHPSSKEHQRVPTNHHHLGERGLEETLSHSARAVMQNTRLKNGSGELLCLLTEVENTKIKTPEDLVYSDSSFSDLAQ